MTTKTKIASILILVSSFALSGCASKTSADKADDEYEYITVTGSNLRVKVKKGTRTPVDGKTAAPVATMEGSAIHDGFETPKTVGDLGNN
ncbi:hypothetical protein [Actomonas aquatica]|uniref:Lipoprotein n=1 Tax=Actomonas aquatica TaxID=2866162 RepID=A0ABZ1CEX7_9BACT|nr:hypothetical protein [Opitutus sp. WL0086]WRQ89783.1 hypothetical protein K1X11_010230 [Opitutus sp. WL0086]